MMKKQISVFLMLLTGFMPILATHNRAGEITLSRIDELSYEITITTFTYTLSPADRSYLDVNWGDNTLSRANRIVEIHLPHNYKKNVYKTTHTFPGPGVYQIVVQDPNRNEGVKNIPNSVNVIFSIKTTILINPALGENSTPVLLNPPIDRAGLHQVFIHNPAAFDPDGDSISYKLTVCTEADGKPIEDYSLPAYSDTLYVNPLTGDLIWDVPVDTGDYNIAIDVEEWRSGVKIGNIVRDMQITVYNTDNSAPVQNEMESFCVQAGKEVLLEVEATDVDGDLILLSATGGPFVMAEHPASYTMDSLASTSGYSKAVFRWQTDCSHVRFQDYAIVFKAEDRHPETPLVDIKNMSIKVLGPPPPKPTLIPAGNSVTLFWSPDSCSHVRTYQVYRKRGPAAYVPDSCTGGIPEHTGYELISTMKGRNDTLLVDDNNGEGLSQGDEYCYVIVSVYPDGSLSFPSEEGCTPLVEGSPSLLQTSVEEHGNPGRIRISWAKPGKLDTIPANGPYEYRIHRSADLLGKEMSLIGQFETADLNDTTWLDETVDSQTFPWTYRVSLYNNAPGNQFLIGQPETASTLIPELKGEDKKVIVTMKKNVPWINREYTIYRQDPGSLDFDSIGFSTDGSFIDSGLSNGEEYSYLVRSKGWRVLDGQLYQNENFSHIARVTPTDSTAPCPPALNGFSACDSGYNHLNWSYAGLDCGDDVVGYELYYSPTFDASPTLLASFQTAGDTLYDHYTEGSLTGCYYVTAVDSFRNVSAPSVRLCLDECSSYILPNVFSPNNDGVNDIYRSQRAAFVERVDMKIFNRWGLLVFETEDPDINWDGKTSDSDQLVSPGVYYYICNVYEQRLSGIEVRALTGFIYVYSGDSNDVFIETK